MRLGGSGGAAAEEELSGCCKELFKEMGLGGSGVAAAEEELSGGGWRGGRGAFLSKPGRRNSGGASVK